MKVKKLLALTLALILALSCMSITAFAEPQPYEGEYFSKDITINVPEITVGTTAAQVKEGVTFADDTIANDLEIVEAIFFVSLTEIADSVATSGKYYLRVMLKIKDLTATYGAFDMGEESTGYAYKKTVTFSGNNQFADAITEIVNEFDSQTHIACTNVENTSDPYIYCCTVKSFELYDATLDLDDSTTDILDTKSGIEQTYTATVNTPKTDKTKVQVSWKLEDITVTVTNNKIWDPDTLTWIADTSKTNGAAATDPTAEFNFKNLSSKDVYAKLTFTKGEKYSEPTKAFTDNDVADGDGIICLGNKATSAETDNTGKIKLALTVTDSDFDAITSDTTGTYGTYTVKISAKDPTEYTITFDKQDGTGGTDSIKVVSGEKLTAITPPTREGYTFEGYFVGTGDADAMWYIEDGTPNITDPITADKTLYAHWSTQN